MSAPNLIIDTLQSSPPPQRAARLREGGLASPPSPRRNKSISGPDSPPDEHEALVRRSPGSSPLASPTQTSPPKSLGDPMAPPPPSPLGKRGSQADVPSRPRALDGVPLQRTGKRPGNSPFDGFGAGSTTAVPSRLTVVTTAADDANRGRSPSPSGTRAGGGGSSGGGSPPRTTVVEADVQASLHVHGCPAGALADVAALIAAPPAAGAAAALLDRLRASGDDEGAWCAVTALLAQAAPKLWVAGGATPTPSSGHASPAPMRRSPQFAAAPSPASPPAVDDATARASWASLQQKQEAQLERLQAQVELLARIHHNDD